MSSIDITVHLATPSFSEHRVVRRHPANDLPEDVIRTIFSYLPVTPAHRHLAAVNHSWRSVAESNAYWAPLFCRLTNREVLRMVAKQLPQPEHLQPLLIQAQDMQKKQRAASPPIVPLATTSPSRREGDDDSYCFRAYCLYRRIDKELANSRKRRYEVLRKMNDSWTVLQFCYSLVIPAIFGLALISWCVTTGLLLDGTIAPTTDNVHYCMLPIVIASVLYFVTVGFLLVDPLLVSPMLGQAGLIYLDRIIASGSSMIGLAPLMIPVSFLCQHAKMVTFANANISWSVAFIPVYVVSLVVIVVLALLIIGVRTDRVNHLLPGGFTNGESEPTTIFIIAIVIVLHISFGIQLAFLAARLDGAILWPWSAVFAPTFAVFSLLLLSALGTFCTDLGWLVFAAIMLVMLLLSPILIFAILVAVKLDAQLALPWINVFASLLVGVFIVSCIACLLPVITLSDTGNLYAELTLCVGD